jgi:hypothetical protein
VIGLSLPPDVDTVAEIESLASAAFRVMRTAAGQTPTPLLSAGDLALLQVSGVTEDTIVSVRASIAATEDSGSAVDRVVKLRNLVGDTAAVGVVLSAPSTSAIDTPITLTAQVVDRQGRPAVLSSAVRFRLASSVSGASFVPASPLTLAAGTSTTTVIYQSPVQGQQTVDMVWLQTGSDANAPDRTPGSATLTLGRRSQDLSFAEIPAQGLGVQVVSLTATASSGLPVTFSSQTPAVCSVSGAGARLLALGSCVVRASQAGGSSWDPIQLDRSFAVVSPSLTWGTDRTTMAGAGGTASVGLAVSPSTTGWQAASGADWLTTTSSGTGSGTVVMTAAPNRSWTRRSTTVTVGNGVAHTVSQDPLVDLRMRVADVQGRLVTLQWTYDGPATRGFIVEGDVIPGGRLASLPVGQSTMLTVSVGPGRYYARVRVVEDEAGAWVSNEVPVIVGLPVAPSAPTVPIVSVDGSRVTLNWMNTFTGGEPDALSLQVSGAYSGVIPVGRRDGVGYVDVPSGAYAVQVLATNPAGTSASSPPVTVNVPTACVAPQTPTWVSVGRDGNFASMRWEPAESGGAAIDYIVTAAGFGVYSTGGRRVIGGVVPPGTYRVSVQAVNTCGISAPSQVMTIVVP